MAHANLTMTHRQERTPATKEELRQRRPIDLLAFQLLETFESFTNFDPRDYNLRLLDLPSHAITVAAVTEALDQEPEVALMALDRVMDSVDGYMGICELEEWPDDEARLKVCWDQFDDLLRVLQASSEYVSSSDTSGVPLAHRVEVAA